MVADAAGANPPGAWHRARHFFHFQKGKLGRSGLSYRIVPGANPEN
jgi:hypothetical protein